MYIITMSNNPFLSKEVKLKRVFKGFAIGFPLIIMIFVIGNHYINLVDDALRTHYVGKKQEKVLGVKESKPQLIGSYGDISENDTFVWDWDPYWEREGYYQLDRFIEDPEYFIASKKFALKDSWTLRNGYKLSVSCIELDMRKANPGDTYPCTISYNGQLLSRNLRYEAYCKDSEKLSSCHGLANLRVFSETYGDSSSDEYVVVSEWASGSKDWIYVYRLNNGTATLLPFLYNGKEEEKWFISSYAYDMYGLYSTWENEINFNDPLEFVTYFHEPSMGATSGEYMNNVEGIFRIWSVEDDKLRLKETVVDLYREEDIAHWL